MRKSLTLLLTVLGCSQPNETMVQEHTQYTPVVEYDLPGAKVQLLSRGEIAKGHKDFTDSYCDQFTDMVIPCWCDTWQGCRNQNDVVKSITYFHTFPPKGYYVSDWDVTEEYIIVR